MRLFIFLLLLFFLPSSSLRAFLNVDSIFALRYTKTLSDSVFEVGDVIRAPDIQCVLSVDGFKVARDTALWELSQFYLRNPYLVTEIQVHTDARGSDRENLEWSLRCAHCAVSSLLQRYASPFLFAERMVPVGKGETCPLIDLDFITSFAAEPQKQEFLHQLNRRFEIKVTGQLGKSFYENRAEHALRTESLDVRNPAYYEDLIRIADRALLEGNPVLALEYYGYAADLAPVNERYAAEQRDKLKTLLHP